MFTVLVAIFLPVAFIIDAVVLERLTPEFFASLAFLLLAWFTMRSHAVSLVIVVWGGLLFDLFLGMPLGAGAFLLLALRFVAVLLRHLESEFAWGEAWRMLSFLFLFVALQGMVLMMHAGMRYTDNMSLTGSYLRVGLANIFSELIGASALLCLGIGITVLWRKKFGV